MGWPNGFQSSMERRIQELIFGGDALAVQPEELSHGALPSRFRWLIGKFREFVNEVRHVFGDANAELNRIAEAIQGDGCGQVTRVGMLLEGAARRVHRDGRVVSADQVFQR